MYHFLVSANPEAWDGRPWDIERDRVLRDQYTADPLKEKYAALNEADVAALMRFPVLFAQENANRNPARIETPQQWGSAGICDRIGLAADCARTSDPASMGS